MLWNARAAARLEAATAPRNSMCNERNEMANAVSLFLNYPQFLIVTGTAMLILGLLGFALFIPSDVESAEDRLAERPRLFDKSEPLFGEAEGEQGRLRL